MGDSPARCYSLMQLGAGRIGAMGFFLPDHRCSTLRTLRNTVAFKTPRALKMPPLLTPRVLKMSPLLTSSKLLLYQLSHQLNHLARSFSVGISVAKSLAIQKE